MSQVSTQGKNQKSKMKEATKRIVEVAGNSRGLLGLLVVLGLTGISLTFNWQLGKLSAPDGDDISGRVMPLGYAMLDLAALFICGYIGVKSKDKFRKAFAWFWFAFLLSLSLWAAMSYAISVDYRTSSVHHSAKIAALQGIVEDRAAQVDRWQANLDGTQIYKSRYQGFLDQASREHAAAVAKLNAAYDSDIPHALAIYYAVAPMVGIGAETLATVMRLVWAAGLTLSPLVVFMLVVAEHTDAKDQAPTPTTDTPPGDKQPKPKPRRELPENIANFPAQQGNRAPFPAAQPAPAAQKCEQAVSKTVGKTAGKAKRPALEIEVAKAPEGVEGVKGNNQHTATLDLNGLKKARVWLESQPEGRVTRNKLQAASGVKGRDSVSKIIAELLNDGDLVRLGNGQLAKPDQTQRKPMLRAVLG